ncbi:hypothetical protein SARC_05969, partial [Sphaeroforma arctica JP610]
REVEVKDVFSSDGTKLTYNIEEKSRVIGQCLSISVGPKKKGDKVVIKVEYVTSPDASGIQWLLPANTAGKKYPYLFTQNQAIHARSMYPCQDTPQAKITYTASVTVPDPLTALMSAAHTGKKSGTDGKTTFTFEQKIPMPTYLVALAVGDIVGKEIGPRTTLYSEREMIDAGAYEFAETESFLLAGEKICGPYVWGRYDILLLPPSFPYGGMENPCLTFVTPTLLAGDRSQANVVAHEIAHSWTGNLVSTNNWECFYVNEGFTVWLERKILAEIFDEHFRSFHALLGLQHLQDDIDLLGETNPLTALDIKLGTDISPDDSFSSVPYEKGSAFLFYLETLVGAEPWGEFFKAYIKEFSYKTVTTKQWTDYLKAYLEKKNLSHTLKEVDWNAWLNNPGMPPVTVPRDMVMYNAVEAFRVYCEELKKENRSELESCTLADDFVALQWVLLLNELRANSDKLSLSLVRALDSRYNLNAVHNSEIRFVWQLLCLKLGDEIVFPQVIKFITEQGRMKYVRPLYRALAKCSPAGEELALETFKKHKKFYHNTAAAMVAKDLRL